MPEDQYVEFRSNAGNRIICPSEWTSDDRGAWWILDDHDQASLLIYTCTIEGSGTSDEFLKFAANLVTKGDPGWKPVDWLPIDINGIGAARGRLVPDTERDEFAWELFVLESGKYYHTLILRTSELVMTLNGGVYESIVRTFKGIT